MLGGGQKVRVRPAPLQIATDEVAAGAAFTQREVALVPIGGGEAMPGVEVGGCVPADLPQLALPFDGLPAQLPEGLLLLDAVSALGDGRGPLICGVGDLLDSATDRN